MKGLLVGKNKTAIVIYHRIKNIKQKISPLVYEAG